MSASEYLSSQLAKLQVDISNLPKEQQDAIAENNKSAAAVANTRGVLGGHLIEPIPLFDRAPHEKVFAGDNNTFIVLGRDRPSHKASGYGGKGATQAGAMDFVVGRMSSAIEGIKPDVFVSPNFFTDAARIYISQKTDIDKDFGLAPGKVGMKEESSGIGIKADEVRIVGRTGLKLVTGGAQGVKAGKAGEKTAHGFEIGTASKIDFIAGNNSLNLQPLVKGGNLIECINALVKRINDLATVVDNMHRIQHSYNTILARHTHAGATGPTGPSLPAIMGMMLHTCESAGKFVSPFAAFKTTEYFDIKSKFLTRKSYKYICSRYVSTT